MEQSRNAIMHQANQALRSAKIIAILFLLIIIFFALPLITWVPAPQFALPTGASELVSNYLSAIKNDECEGCQEFFYLGSVRRTEECKKCQHFYSSNFVSHLYEDDLPSEIATSEDFRTWSVQRVSFHILHPLKLWKVRVLLQFDQNLALPIELTIERQKDGSWKIADLWYR